MAIGQSLKYSLCIEIIHIRQSALQTLFFSLSVVLSACLSLIFLLPSLPPLLNLPINSSRNRHGKIHDTARQCSGSTHTLLLPQGCLFRNFPHRVQPACNEWSWGLISTWGQTKNHYVSLTRQNVPPHSLKRSPHLKITNLKAP